MIGILCNIAALASAYRIGIAEARLDGVVACDHVMPVLAGHGNGRIILLGAGHLAASGVAVCCVLALLIPGAVTTFGVGTTKTKSGSTRLTARGLALKRTGAGEEKAVDAKGNTKLTPSITITFGP